MKNDILIQNILTVEAIKKYESATGRNELQTSDAEHVP